MLLLKDLEPGEYFIYKKHKYKRCNYISGHHNTINCIDDEYRHRPFKDTVEIEPCQMRLEQTHSPSGVIRQYGDYAAECLREAINKEFSRCEVEHSYEKSKEKNIYGDPMYVNELVFGKVKKG